MPDKLYELNIRSYRKEHSIRLDFGQYQNYLGVSGKDETWVLGTYQRIESFLEGKRPWFYSRKFILMLLILTISLLGGITMNLINNKYFITSSITAIMILYINYIIYTGKFIQYFPYFVLEISPQLPLINKDNLMIILAIFALFATIIGGIIIPLIKK